MTWKGKVTNGVVVLEDPKALPEGTSVKVELVSGRRGKAKAPRDDAWKRLLRWAGRGKGLPSDLARNHDHYLHGRPRK
jgi:tartrate dehydratase beta subunit/fumarate hydratase class I family protein